MEIFFAGEKKIAEQSIKVGESQQKKPHSGAKIYFHHPPGEDDRRGKGWEKENLKRVLWRWCVGGELFPGKPARKYKTS